MRRLISWLIMVPTAVAVVIFALHNKEPIALNLWPFALVVEMELYLILTLILAAGVVLGGVVSWAGGGRLRAELRKQTYEGEVARRELRSAQDRIAALEGEVKGLKAPQISHGGADGATVPTAQLPGPEGAGQTSSAA